MSAYKPYPKYKKSGVEWVGQIPTHWIEAPTFAKTEESKAKNTLGLYDNVLSLSYGNIVRRNVEDNFGLLPESFNTYQIVRSGDVILRLTDLQNDKRSLRVGLAKEIGIITSAYLNLRAKSEIDTTYLYRLLHSYDTTKVFYGMGGGLRQSMKFEDFRRLPLLLPPLPEQRQIASFLDRECGKLDALQAKQERLIELLKEKRQALISHAVTKGLPGVASAKTGLDPTAKLKPSGIEWLGEVPVHWRVGKCGFYLTILSGFAFPSTGFTQDDSETKLLRGINVGVSKIKWDETVYWQRSENDGLGCYEMKAGDLVVGMDRPWISGGVRVAKITEDDLPCLLLQRVTSLKTNSSLMTDYLYRFLSSEMFVAYFTPDTTGVSVPHLSPDQICDFVIPIPPLAEQRAIVAHLDEKCGKIDQLKAKAERAIVLLKERRSALISAAVTGKIDVREN